LKSKNISPFDFRALKRERVAQQCVCCGSSDLDSSIAVLMPFLADRIFGWSPTEINEEWGLKSIPSGMAYSICKSLYCLSCNFLFLDIRFSDAELGKLYADYRGDSYNSQREHYEPGYSSRNDALNAGIEYIPEIEKFLKPWLNSPITLLDWGGDTGKNTPFKNTASTLDIYDISNKDCIPGAKIVTKEQAKSQNYSLIICSNVLEHVPYPSDLLFDIKGSMDGNSILYLEVPLEDLIKDEKNNPHLKKRHWHEHINFYSETSLRSLIQNCGLEVLELKILQATAGNKAVNLYMVACKLA